MIVECANFFFGSVAAMDMGWNDLVFFVFGDHELLQDIGVFVVEVVDLGFDSALFQECLDFYICGEQIRYCPSFQRLSEDCAGVAVVHN